MTRLFADADVGRKNIGLGLVLFLFVGVGFGIPLSVNLFGGSALTSEQYQIWKVVHAYGVFLSFINYFAGLFVDRLNVTRNQKEITSWAFFLAGFIGGFGRMLLVLLSALSGFALYVSLLETVLFVLGTFMILRGQLQRQLVRAPERSAQAQFNRRVTRS